MHGFKKGEKMVQKNKRKALGLTLLAASVAPAGVASELTNFSYAVRLAALDSQTCEQQADSLKARFEIATGLTVTQAICKGPVTLHSGGTDYALNRFELDYRAESEATLSAAIFAEPEVATP